MSEKNKIFNNFFVGLVLGFIIPVVVLYFLYLFNKIPVSFADYVSDLNENRILTKVLSICTLPVLGAFYFFLKKNWYSTVKGIIFSVFLMIFWVMYVNYFK